jgi:hypothetical protein
LPWLDRRSPGQQWFMSLIGSERKRITGLVKS